MPGGLRDLNDLIPPNSGWVLKEARDINNSGDIVGYGSINGVNHAFLLERFDGGFAVRLPNFSVGPIAKRDFQVKLNTR